VRLEQRILTEVSLASLHRNLHRFTNHKPTCLVSEQERNRAEESSYCFPHSPQATEEPHEGQDSV
jgi:hypothetical protein